MMRRVFVLTVAGVAFAGAASAQTDSAASVCAAMATDAERNACIRGVEAARADAALPAPGAPARDVQQSGEDQGGGFLGLGIFGRAGDGAEVAESETAGLGAETLNAPAAADIPENRVQTAIVAFREHVPGILEFELDNGQVWRQTSGVSPEALLSSRRPEPVEMWSSWAGGFRMRLVNHGQTLRVKRLR